MTPDEVRGCTLSDFDAVFDGWKAANGHADKSITADALDDLDELMARYPDKVVH